MAIPDFRKIYRQFRTDEEDKSLKREALKNFGIFVAATVLFIAARRVLA